MSLPIAQSIPPGKIVLTYEDYCLLPNDRNRYEILDGDLSVTPAPSVIHQIILGNLHRIIATFLITTPLGRVLLAPTDVILAQTTVVQPDLIFVANDRLRFLSGRALEGSPTLAVEILSPTTSQVDRTTKAQLYAKYGVPNYWLIDPEQQIIDTYDLTGDRYIPTARFGQTDIFSSALFPGLSFPATDLWA